MSKQNGKSGTGAKSSQGTNWPPYMVEDSGYRYLKHVEPGPIQFTYPETGLPKLEEDKPLTRPKK